MTKLLALIEWGFVVSGLTYVLTRSVIFGPVRQSIGLLLAGWSALRDWVRILIYCTACTGFWVGAFTVGFWPFDGPWQWIASGLAALTLGTLWAKAWDPHVYYAEGFAWGDSVEDDPPEDEQDAEAKEERDE